MKNRSKKTVVPEDIKQQIDGEQLNDFDDAVETDYSDTTKIKVVSEDFPFCCGISVLGEFPNRSDIISITDKVGDWLKKYSTVYPLVVTLSERQYNPWLNVVKAAGFKAVHEFKNPNSGNMVTLLLRPEGKKK